MTISSHPKAYSLEQEDFPRLCWGAGTEGDRGRAESWKSNESRHIRCTVFTGKGCHADLQAGTVAHASHRDRLRNTCRMSVIQTYTHAHHNLGKAKTKAFGLKAVFTQNGTQLAFYQRGLPAILCWFTHTPPKASSLSHVCHVDIRSSTVSKHKPALCSHGRPFSAALTHQFSFSFPCLGQLGCYILWDFSIRQ